MSNIPADVRERVIKSATELREQTGEMPTVDAVRRHAKVDMNAASAIMREWRRAQTAQAAPVAVTVPEAVTQANSAALAALWQTAQQLANESLRAAQAGWEAERAEAEQDRHELAEAYERQAGDLEELRTTSAQAAETHEHHRAAASQELERLNVELAKATTRAERAEAAAQEIGLRADDLRAELGHAHEEQQRNRDALAAANARAERAEAGKQETEQRAAALAGELAQVKATATAAEQLHSEQKKAAATEALRQAERFTQVQSQRDQAAEQLAEARENAARLAGQLEAVQAQSAALLSRLDARDTKKRTPQEKQ